MENSKAIISPFKLFLGAAFILFVIFTIFLTNKISSPEQLETMLKNDKFTSETNTVRDKKVRIIIDSVTEVMSGLYPQYRKLNIPVISVEIENPFPYSISVYMESEITGASHKTRTIEIVKAKDRIQISQYPSLLSEMNITNNKNLNLHYLIKIDGSVVTENSTEVKFVARDVLFWGYIDSNNKFVDTSMLIAGWVTPNTQEIRQLLKDASYYHPNEGLYGYQLNDGTDVELRDYARDQVKAIYNSLKYNYEINYVNTPVSFTPKNIVAQRINLPSETLLRGIANCIDSTVLFASALEAIGLHPYIVILPGHSLLAWSIDKNRKKLDFLDVTYVKDVNFDDALKIAYDRIENEDIDFSQESSEKYSIISIKNARDKLNIDPME